jgi:hypothetical protein
MVGWRLTLDERLGLEVEDGHGFAERMPGERDMLQISLR